MDAVPTPSICALFFLSARVTWEIGYRADHGQRLRKSSFELSIWGHAPESITILDLVAGDWH